MELNRDKPVVLIVMGSDSDLPVVSETAALLKELSIPFKITVASAHRTPQMVREISERAKEDGFEVIIAAAGAAAHLSGVIASYTLLPVIGIPLSSSPLSGIDALLSTVQMPAGTPVGTMAIGKSGAKNAALFAARILGIKYSDVEEALNNYYEEMRKSVTEKAEKISNLYTENT